MYLGWLPSYSGEEQVLKAAYSEIRSFYILLFSAQPAGPCWPLKSTLSRCFGLQSQILMKSSAAERLENQECVKVSPSEKGTQKIDSSKSFF